MISFDRGVFLDTVKEESLKKILKWRNNPQIWQWCRQNDLIPWSNHEKWFLWQSESKDVRMYEIHNSNHYLVGVCGLTSIDMLNQRAEFSLYIGPEYQQLGLAKKALATLLDHAFLNLNLRTVWGESFDKNPACGMFLKLGFQKTGLRRDHYFRSGKFIDAHLFDITKQEWEKVNHAE